jgi:hypothetical protein
VAGAAPDARGALEAKIHERMKAFAFAYVVQWTE